MTIVSLNWMQKGCASTLCAWALVLGAPALAQPSSICGDLAAAQGPYDYRVERYWVTFIERNHFTPLVEAGIRGVSGHPGGDIDFLLRYVPNHPRGLVAMQRLSERMQWNKPPGATYDVECYYDRALRFRPDDVVPRVLYAGYLGKRARLEQALTELSRAVTHAGDNGFSHYNIGLQYVELGQFDKALVQAHRALELEFGRTELRDRLRAAGRWQDPPPASVPAPASAASQ